MTMDDIQRILDRFDRMEKAQVLQAQSIDQIAEGLRDHLAEAQTDHDALVRLAAEWPGVKAEATTGAEAAREMKATGRFVRNVVALMAGLVTIFAGIVTMGAGLHWF